MKEVVGVAGCGSRLICSAVNPKYTLNHTSVLGEWRIAHLNDEAHQPVPCGDSEGEIVYRAYLRPAVVSAILGRQRRQYWHGIRKSGCGPANMSTVSGLESIGLLGWGDRHFVCLFRVSAPSARDNGIAITTTVRSTQVARFHVVLEAVLEAPSMA